MSAVLKNARFIAGASSIKAFPKSNLDEVAIVGRSNVGKSTFLNTLGNNSKLSRVSSTPGRTQEINFFEFALRGEAGRRILIADLPGFGFAKFSKEKREMLSKLTVDYIVGRKQLQVVCLLNDCRRDPGEEELAIRDLVFNSGKHCIIIMTKTDKLKSHEIRKRAQSISAEYQLQPEDLLLSSKNLKTDQFWTRIGHLLDI